MPFCTNCGSQMSEGSKFCTGCGARFDTGSQQPVTPQRPVGAQPPVGAQQPIAPPPPAAPVYQQPSAPAGGPDYSIEGGSLPVVIIRMKPGECLLSEAGARTWSRGPVLTEATSEGGVGKALGRMFSGESLFLSKYTAQGPAEIAFASSFPGRILARTLAPGESIVCQKKAFLAATYGVQLAVHFQKKLGAGLVGGEGFIMQRVTGPGTVFLELDGHCVDYTLAPGEQLVCDTGVLAVMDATCQLDVQMVKGLKNVFFGGEGLFDTVVTGPGKVSLQTMTIPQLARLISPFLPNKN